SAYDDFRHFDHDAWCGDGRTLLAEAVARRKCHYGIRFIEWQLGHMDFGRQRNDYIWQHAVDRVCGRLGQYHVAGDRDVRQRDGGRRQFIGADWSHGDAGCRDGHVELERGDGRDELHGQTRNDQRRALQRHREWRDCDNLREHRTDQWDDVLL